MTPKLFITIGLIFLALGALTYINQKLGLGFGHLPGDIDIKRGNTRLYFPIVSCAIVSILISAIMWLWHQFK